MFSSVKFYYASVVSEIGGNCVRKGTRVPSRIPLALGPQKGCYLPCHKMCPNPGDHVVSLWDIQTPGNDHLVSLVV